MHNSTELVIRQDDRLVTTSRLVAGKFEKLHKNILQAIEKLECSDEFRRLNFQLSSYMSEQNKELPEYLITRDGFSFLVMGFTGAQAAKFKEDFINAFNKMENALKATPKSSLDLARESIQALTLMYNAIEQQNARLSSHEEIINQLGQRITEVEGTRNGEYFFTIMAYASIRNKPVNLKIAAHLGKLATPRCKDLGIEVGRIKDPRFGMINTYPESVLSELFDEYFQPEYKAA